ncbi:hypothetical protein K7432_012310 [Basidiobolus ranarum]|uniref:C2H2-type domain-containing protein n=1 Tax=Basidiobolus ranarum TaxID=34480 RepID=A0ABR2WL52_9FUNG
MKTTSPSHNHYQRKAANIACKICCKSFNRKDNYTRHYRAHTGDFLHVCLYSDCHKGFTRSDQLTRHITSKHRIGTPDSDCNSIVSDDSIATISDHSSDIDRFDREIKQNNLMSIHNLIHVTIFNPAAAQPPSRMELTFLMNSE